MIVVTHCYFVFDVVHGLMLSVILCIFRFRETSNVPETEMQSDDLTTITAITAEKT